MDKIDLAYKVLSISHLCRLLGISRSRYYYGPSTEQDDKDFNLLMKIKEVHIEYPYYGYRRIWRVFNTMDALQYANLLRETIEEYGCPAIFNTDQGSQFTSILNATKQ